MKTIARIALALALVAGAVTTAQAQKADLRLGYGGYTQMDGGDYGPGKANTAWGAVTAELDFNIAPKFKLGPSYTFSSAGLKHSDGNKYYHAILLNGRYQYFRNSIVRLSAHVGMGVLITHTTWHDESDTKGDFGFHVSPLSADFAIARNIDFFAEVGYGAMGVLQAGLRINL